MQEISNKYHVVNRKEQKIFTFAGMDEALKYYDSIWGAYEKELHVELPFVTGTESRVNKLLIYNTDTHSSVVPEFSDSELNNPRLALAYSRACIHCEPDNAVAWAIRDEAEQKLGITERVVDHSEDLLVGYWRVHVIPVGGRYGKHNELINNGKPGVEFYDIRYTDNELAPLGLGIKRCYVDEILNIANSGSIAFLNGFNLHPQIPHQTLSSDEMNKVVKYLNSFVPQKERTSLSEQIAQAEKKATVSEKSSKQQSREFEAL